VDRGVAAGGYMSEERASEWRVKIGAWKLWLELQQDHAH
jgi:hypothetical protein